jgi:glyoxylase-like metal-dependent hydrolase (beta-lactamase superfamily II)
MDSVVRKLYVLDGGLLELDASVMVSGDRLGTRIRIPVQMFLAETSKGYVLIDTGNNPDVIDDAEKAWGVQLAQAATPIMTPENHPYAQLKLLGLSADDIKMVIYTHLHHDHCGGARFFPDALHVVQKAEYRWVSYPDRFSTAPYVPYDYGHQNLRWQLAEGDWCIMPGIHLISTPGHTPGHQSIALYDIPESGTVILTGDAVNCQANIATDTPGGITSDATAAVASLHRLTALARATDARVIVSHDLAVFERTPKAPQSIGRLSEDFYSFCEHGVKTLYGQAANPDSLI